MRNVGEYRSGDGSLKTVQNPRNAQRSGNSRVDPRPRRPVENFTDFHRRRSTHMRKRELKMRILITNDDGIDSLGIGALAHVFRSEHSVAVVAPSGNRSGVSHAITADEAITMERRHDTSVLSYSCSGTPADCVFLGSTELSPSPALVISGINHGPNLADDVYYSGTVAGAVEAALLGIPALAVSLACDHTKPF